MFETPGLKQGKLARTLDTQRQNEVPKFQENNAHGYIPKHLASFKNFIAFCILLIIYIHIHIYQKKEDW